jgi:DNA-binding MarR family transcriptional regulator
MPYEPIPDDIRDLIQRHIDSVAQLEALLFLRARPSETLAASAIASRLYAPETELARSLAQLAQDGFLVRENDQYRYECAGEKRLSVDRLAEAYSRHLIPITNLIHAKPRNIRQFSDAFKFRTGE